MRIFMLLSAWGFILCLSSPLAAGGIDNKNNFSAEYVRTLNRNAANDSADAVVYNPAGVMDMEEGAYVDFSAQHIRKDYTNRLNSVDLDQDKSSLVPGLFALCRQDKWSAFAAFTIPGGGGKVEYNNGNATTAITGQRLINATPHTSIGTQRIDAGSFYYGCTLGCACRMNDRYSLSIGARYIDAFAESRGKLIMLGGGPGSEFTTDYEKTACGWGGIIGLGITPEGPVNMGIRFETRTKLDFVYTVKTDTYSGPYGLLPLLASQGIATGIRERRDLPGLLGLGAGFRLSPRLRLDTSLTYYLQEYADWNRAEENVDNGFDAGLSLEYLFSDKLKGSIGFMLTDTGIEAGYMTKEAPQLSANTIGIGTAYRYRPNLYLNFSMGRVFYRSDSYIDTGSGSLITIDYEKDLVIIALGMQYKFK